MPAKKKSVRPLRHDAEEVFPANATLSVSVAKLAHAAPSASPSAAVKAGLLARIRASQTPVVGAPGAAPVEAGWRFESVHDANGWFVLPVPGVRMKKLSADPKRDVIQLLIEIAPGARFPDHDHIAGDEGIVLSGDVLTGGRLMRAGDYYHAGPGTKHTDIISPSGCTALVTASITAFNRWREELAAQASH